MKTPVAFFIYRRLETTVKVLEEIRKVKPVKLYLVADGPKSDDEIIECQKTRNSIEKIIDWDCKLIKLYSNTNLGCAKRIQTGLDYVFENEEMAIILEDDTLPDSSFFNFCEDLLERYKDDMRVAHISGCNLHSNAVNFKESYCFSSIINIWGWATWKRAWINYDINMPSWHNEDKESFISKWCQDRKSLKGIRKMFDLHCNNIDPWTWDYQWVYACWKMNGLSVVPSRNLVSNLGIGPDASNTKSPVSVKMHPSTLDAIHFPLTHPLLERNTDFETKYYRESHLPLIRRIKTRIKSFL